jgi:hypothetical protein
MAINFNVTKKNPQSMNVKQSTYTKPTKKTSNVKESSQYDEVMKAIKNQKPQSMNIKSSSRSSSRSSSSKKETQLESTPDVYTGETKQPQSMNVKPAPVKGYYVDNTLARQTQPLYKSQIQQTQVSGSQNYPSSKAYSPYYVYSNRKEDIKNDEGEERIGVIRDKLGGVMVGQGSWKDVSFREEQKQRSDYTGGQGFITSAPKDRIKTFEQKFEKATSQNQFIAPIGMGLSFGYGAVKGAVYDFPKSIITGDIVKAPVQIAKTSVNVITGKESVYTYTYKFGNYIKDTSGFTISKDVGSIYGYNKAFTKSISVSPIKFSTENRALKPVPSIKVLFMEAEIRRVGLPTVLNSFGSRTASRFI